MTTHIFKTPWKRGADYHRACNKFYDGQDYSVHLDLVRQVCKEFAHLIPAEVLEEIDAACDYHDTIEDCGLNYNDVRKEIGTRGAEIVRAVTSDIRGRTRAERMSDAVYHDIKHTEYATYVKLCDRIANMRYSKMKGSSMIGKYQSEYAHFKFKLYCEEYKEMFDHIENNLM